MLSGWHWLCKKDIANNQHFESLNAPKSSINGLFSSMVIQRFTCAQHGAPIAVIGAGTGLGAAEGSGSKKTGSP